MSHITSEQKSVIENRSNLLAVDAFAGTGKTTTLVEYARRRPGKNILYIAFNKSVASEAGTRFPDNVQCRTTHSLAYASVGKKYQEKLGNPQAWEIAQTFKCTNKRAKDALSTLTNWFCSADDSIAERHLEIDVQTDPGLALQTVALAGQVWELMTDKRSHIKMPHDGYLKMWAMGRPQLRFDIILLDEAQDTNPVTLDVVLMQNCQKVLVGDRHQGIYGFRRAINAMDAVKADTRIALTQSFRFSQAIADIATALLQEFKGETKPITGRADLINTWHIDESQHFTVLGRTNAGLFARAAQLISKSEFRLQKPDIKLHFVGGFDTYVFGKVLDAYFLWADERSRIKDQSIGRFNSFADFKKYGSEASDAEIGALVKTVEEFQNQIPRIYDAIKASEVSLSEKSNVTLTTAHRAKGLEFEQVYMQDDFIELPPKEDFDREEINLLYVALTRAVRAVRLPESLTNWLTDRSERRYAESVNMEVHKNGWQYVCGGKAEQEAWLRDNVDTFEPVAAGAIRFLLYRIDELQG